ncbi:MAG: hypothetical protein HC819_19475 [Cyclobacteriaceae bacterium]|nr:hypothetical protein [Cyclobacteriaceae bacterium]
MGPNPPAAAGTFPGLQGEDEGAAIDLDITISDAQKQGIDFEESGAITCITPAGKPYTLPSNIKTLDFTSNTDDFPDGALINFHTKDNKTYVAVFKRKSKNFLGYAQLINPNVEKAKDRIGYKDEATKIPDCRIDDVTKTLSEESRVLLGKKSDCAINLYQIKYSEVSDKTGISDEGYCGSGTFNNQPLAYNLEGKEPVVVGDNTACLNKHAKEFYKGHLDASPEYKETILRIANLLSSIEGGGDALFTDYQKYCIKAGSGRYYGNPDLWGTPDDYKLFEKALEAYIDNQKNLEKIILEEKDRDKLTDLAWMLVERYSESIDYDVRLYIIKKLSEEAMYGNRFFGKGQEYLANRVIYGIKDTKEQAAFLTELTQNDLLKTLFDRMGDEGGGDNFSTFIMLLAQMAKNNTTTFGVQGDPMFIWVGDLFRSDKIKIDFAPEGKVTLQGFKKEFTCYPSYYGAGTGCVSSWKETSDKYTLSPFAFVPVKFPKGEKYLKTLSDDGIDVTFVPLVYLMALNTKRNVDVGKTTAGIVIDVGSLCIGIGELNMAIKAIKGGATAIKMLRLAAMTADVIITSSDILITLVEDDLQELDGGQEFLEKYKVYSALSGLLLFGADNLTSSPEVLSGLSDSWRKFKNTHADDPKKVINAVGGAERYKTVEELVDKTEEALKQTEHTTLVSKTPDLDDNYVKAIAGIAEDWKKNALGKPISDLKEAPLGYYFYPKKNPEGLRRLNANDPKTPQLKVENGIVVVVNKYAEKLTGVAKGAHQTLVGAGVRYIDDGTTIKYLTKEGEEFAKVESGTIVVTKAKGEIPVPEKLYNQSFINAHEEKFKSEGAGFIVIKSWIEEGQFSVMPPRKFVGLQSEMNEIIKKYKFSGNDWKVLRDELNLGAETNLEGEIIYYIKIDGNDPRFKFGIPNGNEGYPSETAGAIVGEWMPGGKTKNGTSEAVLVGSEVIVHNNKVMHLLDNFKDRWTQIQ